MPRMDRPKEPEVFCAWCISFSRVNKEEWANANGTRRKCLSGVDTTFDRKACEGFRLTANMFHCGVHAGFTTVIQCQDRYEADVACDHRCKSCPIGKGAKAMLQRYPQLDMFRSYSGGEKKEVW